MGFSNLGVSKNRSSAGSKVIRISPSESNTIYMAFDTEYERWEGEYMDIAAAFRGVSKTISEYNGYGDWSDVFYQRWGQSSFTVTEKAANKYRWWKNLHITNDAGSDIMDSLVNNDSWTYANRKYDAINLDLGVDRVNSEGVKYELDLHEKYIYILYKPNYSITDIKYTVDGLVFTYTTTSDWARVDDVFLVWNLTSTSSSGQKKQIVYRKNGTILEKGKFLIKHSDIQRAPQAGESISGTFYLCPSYDPEVTNSANEIYFSTTIKDATKCNPISVTPHEIGYGINFSISETDSGYEAVERVVVKMEPAEFEVDTQSIDELPGVVIMTPPLNKKVTFTITPYGPDGATNESKYYTAYIEADFVILTSLNSGESVFLHYNVLPSFTATPDVNIVKLSGRQRPSAFYGTGGTVEGTLTGTIVDEVHPNASIPYNVEQQTPGEFEIIHFFGDCMLRTPDSMRRWVSVSSIDISTKSKDILHVKDVTIKMTEVR